MKRWSFRPQGVRIVDRSLGRLVRQSRLFHSADHADNGERWGIGRRFAALEKMLAKRAGVWPVISREVLVYDADSR